MAGKKHRVPERSSQQKIDRRAGALSARLLKLETKQIKHALLILRLVKKLESKKALSAGLKRAVELLQGAV